MSDHERGCQGREYTCTCGYDAERDALVKTWSAEAVAKRIVQGVCELQEIPDPDHPDTIIVTVSDLEAVVTNHLAAAKEITQ